MRAPLRLVLALAVTLASLGASSCATVPSEADRKKADGQREVALALVQEAEKASTAGDPQTQDAKYREALRELIEGEKTGALDSDGYYLMGLVYFVGFRKHDEAVAHLAKAIELRQKERDEEYPEAENLMGAVLVDAGRPADAIPHFEKARTNLLYQTPYFAEQGMGDALMKLGRQDEAAAHYQRALVAQPDLCGAYVKLAEVEIARGDDARVQKVLGDFLERCDSDRLRAATGPRLLAPAFLELGKSRLRTGSRDDAMDAFKQCATRFPGEAAARECDNQLRVLDGAAGG
jgi:tetratricopeptide (TPR) repeat protein